MKERASILNNNLKSTLSKHGQCAFNSFVECQEKDRCNRCGWNPSVSKRRAREMQSKFGKYGTFLTNE